MGFRTRRFLVNVLVIILAIVVTLGALEIGLRLFKPQKIFAVTVNTWDREVGTKHIRGAKGFVINPQYQMDLIINSKGLRDREFPYAKPAGTRRILCLGGSFTCGYGVQAEETFAKVLERILNSDEDESEQWEVLNGGVGSTGTAQQLAYFTTEGHKYDPDFVLVCFSQATDFWDNIISGLYSLEDGKLVKHDAPRTGSRKTQEFVRWIPGYTTFFAKSHLLNFVKNRISRYHFRDLARRINLPGDVSAVEEAEEELTRRLLIAMRDACAAIDCRLVMTAIPLPDTWGWYDETVDLMDYVEAEGIPFVDLSPEFRKGADCGVQIAYPSDLHWTREGHELAAMTLYHFFISRTDTASAQAHL
jgi:hypothetical protein